MQRLALQELFGRNNWLQKKRLSSNRYLATTIVVLLAGFLTFMKPGGKGALILWPLFGSLNQLLAGLGLAVISVYLYKKNKNFYLAFIPMLFVLTMTIWSILTGMIGFFHKLDYFLGLLSFIILVLTLWLMVGGIKTVTKKTINGEYQRSGNS